MDENTAQLLAQEQKAFAEFRPALTPESDRGCALFAAAYPTTSCWRFSVLASCKVSVRVDLVLRTTVTSSDCAMLFGGCAAPYAKLVLQMNLPKPPRKLSLPVVPVSFLVLVVLCALLYGWLRPSGGVDGQVVTGTAGIGRLEPFRTPGGTLHTNGFVKTEELRKDDGSWLGTTSSGIRLDAVYRYDIELRTNWNLYIDNMRRTALIVAPLYQPQLPVAVDSRSVQEWTSSGWGRFDKWDQLQALRKEISPFLEAKARSKSYMDLARGDARKTVEEFASDWLLKTKRTPAAPAYLVKVYFADEPDIPFPENKTLRDFLP